MQGAVGNRFSDVGGMTGNNALVDFLAAYGPTSDGNNMYDEFVVKAAEKAQVEPIEIGENRSASIASDLLGTPGRSTVLTGTAGDGKTFTARKVLSLLCGNPSPLLEEITEHRMEDGRKVVFVKDLSEVSEDVKASLVPRMVASFSSREPRELFVLCVNDGTLLRSWEAHSGGSDMGGAILAEFRALLRDDREEHSDGMSFRLVNMSRTSHAATMDAIIEAICNHPRWSECGDCAAQQAGRCPIEMNRAILLKTGEASMRERLRALVEICAADERHLSIRQIIILIVNALLGDAKNGYATPLLNCARANQRAADGEYGFTNPYNNVFGENHPAFRRAQNTAFSALAEFAIGYETNNFFDDLLMEGEADAVDHPVYGYSSYEHLRHSYLEDPAHHIEALRHVLTAQRRRLFFEWPDRGPDDRDRSPWQLSVHTYGDLYLNLLNSDSERDGDKFRRTRPRLIKGLNRALTGSLTETSDRLWLTQPSGVYKGADIPFLVTTPIGWSGRPYRLLLAPPSQPGRPPELQLHAEYPTRTILASLPMTPTLFEYLMRVSDGALPMSFSNQCFQDVRNFQIRCVGRILRLQGDDVPSFSAVDADGEQLQERPIGALEEDV